MKFYGDRSRKEMRKDIRAERKELREGFDDDIQEAKRKNMDPNRLEGEKEAIAEGNPRSLSIVRKQRRDAVKKFNKYQSDRKKDIRLDVRINKADRKEQEARDSGKTRKEKRLADKGARLSAKKK